MSYSIVICSRNFDNLQHCVRALRAAGEMGRVIVVDDGLPDVWHSDKCWACSESPIERIMGEKPFVFARNCNLGIQAAGGDSVVLCNDDAILMSPRGFGVLARSNWAEYGVVGATTNVTGYPAQFRAALRSDTPPVRDAGASIAFMCVYIPRSTIDSVGLLDERFVTYGGEDVDYCIRVREAGLKVGVSDHCYVDHGSLPSTFRGNPRAPGDIGEGVRMLREKWGKKCPPFHWVPK